jgi:hypothetical protein
VNERDKIKKSVDIGSEFIKVACIIHIVVFEGDDWKKFSV